jgi:hypothetical protein
MFNPIVTPPTVRHLNPQRICPKHKERRVRRADRCGRQLEIATVGVATGQWIGWRLSNRITIEIDHSIVIYQHLQVQACASRIPDAKFII